MASAQDLRKRIKSVKNTQQITKAMKMVASARLHKAQQKAKSTTPYANKLAEILRHALSSVDSVTSPFVVNRPVRNTAFLVIGADKGLAGAYTSNLVKETLSLLAEHDKEAVTLVTVGKKPTDALRNRGYVAAVSYGGFSDNPSYADAVKAVVTVRDMFLRGEVDRVIVVFTHFVNTLTYEVQHKQLLPITLEKEENANLKEYLYVPNEMAVLEELLPKTLEMTIYDAMLQSAASELGARMTAMTTATDNAGVLIDTLDLQYNRLRQAQITNEISEIIGGANALD